MLSQAYMLIYMDKISWLIDQDYYGHVKTDDLHFSCD